MGERSNRSYSCRRCGAKVLTANPFFPFCSRRCRLIDLGKWFNEEYRVEGEESGRPEEEVEEPR